MRFALRTSTQRTPDHEAAPPPATGTTERVIAGIVTRALCGGVAVTILAIIGRR